MGGGELGLNKQAYSIGGHHKSYVNMLCGKYQLSIQYTVLVLVQVLEY
jgi:hypothetical protein